MRSDNDKILKYAKMKLNYLYFFAIGLIPVGLALRIFDIPFGSIVFTAGLLGVLVFFLVILIKQLIKKQTDKFELFLEVLIILISPIFYSKYFYYYFGDYIGLIIIPLFLFMAIFYLMKKGLKDFKLTIVTILYLLLIIPMIGLDFNKSPRNYIPIEWYDRYNVQNIRTIVLPDYFKYPETEDLNKKAVEYKQAENYFFAIVLYKDAISIEPDNVKLHFDISDCYAKTNELELAVAHLDTAIMVDNSFSIFYNNRGLLFYKLKKSEKAISDYEKAIQLDPNQSIFYANLALVYNYLEQYDKACENIKKAESLGEDISQIKTLNRIRKKKCN